MKNIFFKLSGIKIPFRWRTFHVYSDSGHSWLKADIKAVFRLGILDKITDFSYISRDSKYIFLEEDEDASLFIRKLKELGCPYKFVYHYSDYARNIRSYRNVNDEVRGNQVDIEFR